MDKKIVLIGGGGHCKSVIDSLKQTNEYSEIFITDQGIPVGTDILGATVVGNDEILPKLRRNGVKYAFVTTGSIGKRENLELRQRLYDEAIRVGFTIPSIIDSTAIVSESVQIQDGVFVGKNAVINCGVKIGKMVIINTGAIVEHECVVGDYSHVSIGAVLAGGVELGEKVFVGANSTIIQCRKIGNNSIIGAGCTVYKDMEDNKVCRGVIKE